MVRDANYGGKVSILLSLYFYCNYLKYIYIFLRPADLFSQYHDSLQCGGCEDKN